MNYQRIYDRIISRAKERKLEAGTYKERHHIIPRCMNGTDDEDNLVDLTPEEHYVCHQLLVKIYPGNIKLMYAVFFLSSTTSKQRKSNKIYGWMRRQLSAHRMNGKIVACKQCNKEFYANKSQVARDRPYCSKECYKQTFLPFVTRCCSGCGGKFKVLSTRTTKHCSRSCLTLSRMFSKHCDYCGCEMLSSKKNVKKYCSLECHYKSRS